MRAIGTSTQFCAVIGNPVAHSLSPAIHNAAYAALGLDFVYLAGQVEDVHSALAGMRALSNFRGMSVTIPHKHEAMRHVDEIRAVDRAIGAINTVVHEGDRLIGLGTDGPGALKALADAQVDLTGKHVLMLGAGGAARMIAFTLAQQTRPAAITLLDINPTLLGQLSGDLAAEGNPAVHAALLDNVTLAEAMSKAQVIIHCTSVGMHPNTTASLVPVSLFRSGQVVFDIVYTPLETRLLADARSRGLQTVSGVEMFINQAVLQFEQFTGVEAPVEVMRRVVMENLSA
ncbi:MAG: shikimate dehydrogenase [Desulfatitalea sp.]|nr:shikimate dehydrogenase [Desulfatitalea sp.]NNK00083.1 shikimate dehydrogenase [Desulfatitalea sp.]